MSYTDYGPEVRESARNLKTVLLGLADGKKGFRHRVNKKSKLFGHPLEEATFSLLRYEGVKISTDTGHGWDQNSTYINFDWKGAPGWVT